MSGQPREIWFEADANSMRGYRTIHWKGHALWAVQLIACAGFIALIAMMKWHSSWLLTGIASVTFINWIVFDRHADFS